MTASAARLVACWGALALGAAGLLPAGVYTERGTQPPLTYGLLPSGNCSGCHGYYDLQRHIEPWNTWAGSMMANAGRDPIFWAALDVANNDGEALGVPGIGEFCLRCHAATGWLAERAQADDSTVPPGLGGADGCELLGKIDEPDNDFAGVSCHLCHRMQVNAAPPPGEETFYYENADFWLDDGNCPNGGSGPCRRGPYDYPPNPAAPHAWAFSTYHVANDICGNCHNVTSPLHNLLDDSGQDTGVPYPIERTFKEWQQSEFSDDQSPEFANCSSCHMPDAAGDPVYASSRENPNRAGNLPIHQLAGGNTWIPQVLKTEYPSLNLATELDATTALALDLLQNRSALVELSAPAAVTGGALTVAVRVTNLSGHKLPTGYGEGRRMWLHVAARDGLGAVFWESGAWQSDTGELSADPQLKVYEVQQGIWNYNGTAECDVDDAVSGKHLFHFVRNDCIALDNRIPPLGFTGGADLETRPVGYVYPETTPGSGVLVNWDLTSYDLPVPAGTASPVTVEATLRYQTASKEYIEFLRDQAVDNGFPDDCVDRNVPLPAGTSRGEYLYALWQVSGRSAPVDMASDTGSAVVAELFADDFESGDLDAWSDSLP